MEQRGALAAMQQLETRSDEELEREQKFKAAAQAILGARAAERYDAKAAREHFRRALAAARPQERMQLRRMADASLALAERRPDDLKEAVERLGQAPPSDRQLLLLRFMGLVAPPPGAGVAAARCAASRSSSCWSSRCCCSARHRRARRLPFGGVSTLAGADARARCSSSPRSACWRCWAAGGRPRRRPRAPPDPPGAERPPCAAATRSRRPTPAQLRARFALGESVEIRRRFNVAPGDEVAGRHDLARGRAARRAAALGPGAALGQGPRASAAR